MKLPFVPLVSRFGRLLRDDSAATALEYAVGALVVAAAAVLASKAIAAALVDYLYRIYLVVTLPVL